MCSTFFFLNRDISFFRYSSAKASNRELVDASMTRPGEIIFPLIHSKYVSNPESKIESWTPGNYGRNISYNILETLFYLILGATILEWKVILPCLRQNLWQSPWRSMAIPPTDIDPENHYLVEECVLPTPVWQGLC